jgi:hypothetical protein
MYIHQRARLDAKKNLGDLKKKKKKTERWEVPSSSWPAMEYNKNIVIHK